MDFSLFFTVFVVSTIIYFMVGIFAGRKTSSQEDYFLAGRSYTVLPLALTLIATQVGAGSLVGTAEEAFRVGYFGLFYNLGMCIGLFILAFGFAKKMRQFNISTTAELFERKYNSPNLRKLASVLSVLTLGGILAAQMVASRKLMATFVPGYEWVIVVFWLTVIIYTMFGGLRAVVATDILQVILIVGIFGAVFAYYFAQTGFVFPTLKVLETESAPINLYGVLLLPALFSLIEQDLAQRFFSAKSPKVAVFAAAFAGVFIMAFSFVPVFFGILAKNMNLVPNEGASALLLVIQTLAGPAVLALVVCALIAAISSTADSLLCAASSNVAQDFGLKKSLWISRLATLVVGIAALIIAFQFDNVIGLIVKSYELSVSCLFVPLFFCYFKKRLYRTSAIFSVTCGLTGFLFLSSDFAGLALSLVGYLIADLAAAIVYSRILRAV